MTEQRRETIACIQTEVTRICKLVEIKEWLVAPKEGVDGIYTPKAQKLYNKLLSQFEGIKENV